VTEESPHRRSSIELRQLRYFVALAEELSFRKAAECLHITQPALSHQIALLERMLGLRLFLRDRRRVALTGAGNALLDDARKVLAGSNAVVLKARRMASAASATLNVGLPPDANRIFIPDIVAGFRHRYPAVKLVLREGYGRELLPELRAGRLDVLFARIPAASDLSDLMVEGIVDEETGLLLAAQHHLATYSEIPAVALQGEQIVIFDRPVNPPLYDTIAQWLERAGVLPRFLNIRGNGVYTYHTLLQVLESGEAVSLSSRTIAHDLPPSIVFRPICGEPLPLVVAAVWSPAGRSAHLRDFLSVARERRDAKPLALAI